MSCDLCKFHTGAEIAICALCASLSHEKLEERVTKLEAAQAGESSRGVAASLEGRMRAYARRNFDLEVGLIRLGELVNERGGTMGVLQPERDQLREIIDELLRKRFE